MLDILIPMYNCENYIKQCIDSIINQTYIDFNVYIINDCSTDKSYEILKKISSKDKRIFIINNNKNEGIATTRQKLLDISNGEDIMFIDADDYLMNNECLEKLYKIYKEKNADIIMSSIVLMKNNKIKINNNEKLLLLDKKEALNDLLYIKNGGATLSGKIFKRKLFNDIYFPKGKIYEDTAVLYKIYSKINSLIIYNIPFYVYRIRNDSTMRTKMDNKNMILIEFSENIVQFINTNYPELHSASVYTIINNCMELLRLKSLSKKFDDRRVIHKTIRKYIKEYSKDKNISLKKKIQVIIAYNNELLFKIMVLIHDVVLKRK